MQYPELLDFSERQLSVRLLRVPRDGPRRRHGENGCRSEDTGVVVDHDAHAGAAGNARARRVVGEYGRGVPRGVTKVVERAFFGNGALERIRRSSGAWWVMAGVRTAPLKPKPGLNGPPVQA